MRAESRVGKVRHIYAFIKANSRQFELRMMCQVLSVTHSGYYAWLKEPI